jgi:DNA repair protein RecN (Recombination protein N)
VLSELAVHHFAIIDHLQVSFAPGFNLLSGETGAGKSILVGAVNLILGGRASQEMIRTGADEAIVEACFHLPGPTATQTLLAQWGVTAADELLIRRTISRSGRNRVVVNGQLCTVQQLQQLAQFLISISGQHEHQRLLNPDTHLELLDAAGHLEAARSDVTLLCERVFSLQERLQRLRQRRAERAAQHELMRFQLAELEAAKLQPDEDRELEHERTLLKHAVSLREAADASHELIYGQRGAVLEQLARVRGLLETLCRIDPDQRPLADLLEQARVHLEELAHALHHYVRRIPADAQRLATVEERLAAILRLAKKYGGGVATLLERITTLHTELEGGEAGEEEERRLLAHLEAARAAYQTGAVELSNRRQAVAEKLRLALEETLGLLDMPRARFAVRFQPVPPGAEEGGVLLSPWGMDRVEFMLSANPGEALKPLARVASGGELSRLLLALKGLLTIQGQAETLVFDEVDAGIGGRTAELVGLQLQKLARTHQIICITHLPQIACRAEHHFQVTKETDGQETVTRIRRLLSEERVEELARMLGGIAISEKTLAHARELLERAQPEEGGTPLPRQQQRGD